jgi:threonine synthase
VTSAVASVQVCETCGTELDELSAASVCPSCGGLLELRHSFLDGGESLSALFADRRRATRGPDASGVWRYRELVLPSARADEVVTHPEGNTPLLESRAVARWAGWDSSEQLLIKHEGHNPTGSFKDRGMTVAITQAKRSAARAVACASTGNTSASLAAYAARAELPALVFVPKGKVAGGKLAQTIAYGARTLFVRGGFDECLALARSASAELGIQLLNSVNPFRIEGQKTIVWELLQDLEWSAPDWIVVPAGNLGNTSAFGKALREAHAAGWIERMPRLAAIQASGANPFYRSYTEAFAQRHRVAAETVASAIRIGDPVSHEKAVAAIRATHGVVEQVTDEELMRAKGEIDAMGIGCEPASATTLAGVRKLRAAGIMRDGERIVCVLTGHILKDPDAILKNVASVEIEPTIEAVERALAATGGTAARSSLN